jgi:poly(3-hydroxybutyrate) depolymerase
VKICRYTLILISLFLLACGEEERGDTEKASGFGPDQPTEQWLQRNVNAGGTVRTYFVWLPQGYDPDRDYPVVYQFHGCSNNREANNVPVEDESGNDAIHVRGRAIEPCWDESETGTGVALFDAMVPQIENEFSVDTTRQFVTGYSSGAFVAHALACVRTHMLRGVATVAGGYWGNSNSCGGPVTALLIHDQNDTSVDISLGEALRDSYLGRNGCDVGATTTPTDYPPCEAYSGCDAGYPVVWCQTSGQDHSRQDNLAAPAFWDFFSTL